MHAAPLAADGRAARCVEAARRKPCIPAAPAAAAHSCQRLRRRGLSVCARALHAEASGLRIPRRESSQPRQLASAKSSVETSLRIFLDSAAVNQLELWLSTGLFHGVTCNPTILKRDGVRCTVKELSKFARHAFDLGAKEIHLQAWGSSVAQMSSTAFDLAGIDPAHVVVKLPGTIEGVQTAALLRDSNVRVNITGLYSSAQVLVAQAVGAEYAAPYLGRMNDAYGGEQGLVQVVEMQRMVVGCQSRLRVMVASLRETADLSKLAAQGCNTFTISPTIASKLFNNSYTIDAAGEFMAAAADNGGDEDLTRMKSPSAARQAETAATS